MAVKYPNLFNVRFSNEDIVQINEMAHSLHMTPSALVRRALREWSDSFARDEARLASLREK